MSRVFIFFLIGIGLGLLVTTAVLTRRATRARTSNLFKPTPTATATAEPEPSPATEPDASPALDDAEAAAPTPEPEATTAAETAEAPPPTNASTSPSSTMVLEAADLDRPLRGVRAVKGTDWRGAERGTFDRKGAAAWLAKVAIRDGAGELRQAQPAAGMDAELESLRGRFAGDLRWFAAPAGTWRMEWELNATSEDGALRGKVRVELSRDGRVVTGSAATGTLAALRRPNGSRAALLAMSTSYLFQLYGAAGPAIAGNVYLRGPRGGYGYAGTFFLTRR